MSQNLPDACLEREAKLNACMVDRTQELLDIHAPLLIPIEPTTAQVPIEPNHQTNLLDSYINDIKKAMPLETDDLTRAHYISSYAEFKHPCDEQFLSRARALDAIESDAPSALFKMALNQKKKKFIIPSGSEDIDDVLDPVVNNAILRNNFEPIFSEYEARAKETPILDFASYQLEFGTWLEEIKSRTDVPLEELMHRYLMQDNPMYQKMLIQMLCVDACKSYKHNTSYSAKLAKYTFILKHKTLSLFNSVKNHISKDMFTTAAITLGSMLIGKYIL